MKIQPFMSLVVGVALLLPADALAQRSAGGVTVIYFVRHGEVDLADPTVPLSAAGKARAAVFAHTVGGVVFTHVFSSHTTRARQMVEPVALRLDLPVRQLPLPGSRIDSVTVSDRSPSRIAVAPLVEALRKLPSGSKALVGVNSDNIYALLNGLGVPVARSGQPCLPGSTCVPCLTRDCFPGGEDQLWVLIVPSDSSSRTLMELRYGAPPKR